MKPKEKCPKCDQIRYMTKHHVKDDLGRKTGEIEKMCRDCHDDVEADYNKRGITSAVPVKITPNEKLQLDYMSGLIPFYATRQATQNRANTV